LASHLAKFPNRTCGVPYPATRLSQEHRACGSLALPREERKRLVRPLSNGSINKTIRLLAAVMELAVEYGHVETAIRPEGGSGC